MDEYTILNDREDRPMRRFVPRNGDQIRHPNRPLYGTRLKLLLFRPDVKCTGCSSPVAHVPAR
jgi:hypothetical protein